MKKKEVKILGLSYSQSQMGSYVVVLSEVKGTKKLPIIIKPADAQQIALKVEGMKSTRPSIHDVFKSFSHSWNLDIQEVLIHSCLEGIFYTKVCTSNGVDSVDIEVSVGDALALAITFECPIFVNSEVMIQAGIEIADDGTLRPSSEEEEAPEEKKSIVSVEDLEKMMSDALQNEEYEIAAEIRDKIQSLKGQK